MWDRGRYHAGVLIDELERIAYGTVAVTTRALAETAGPTELTFLGWRVLILLGAADEPMRLRQVAERLGASAPSASRLVRRLERRGLITTGPDSADRRGLRIGLSEAGAHLHDAVLLQRRRYLEEILDEPLPADVTAALATLGDRLARWS